MINYSARLNAELRDCIDDEFPENEFSDGFRKRVRHLFASAAEERAQQLLVERTQKTLNRVVTKRVSTNDLMRQRAVKIGRLLA
jgi:predicted ATP-binding protein involved in virulence